MGPTRTLENTSTQPAAAQVDAPSPRPFEVLGRYVLFAEIGRGGMGVVWSAYDPVLDRKVALKLLRFDDAGAGSSPQRARLQREAQALARLTHPNVVVVHDAGLEGDVAYVAMEFVVGRTLREWLAEGAHPVDEVLDVMTLAGRGLEAAHKAGLVHRDFKPSNVLLGDDGRVRVSDFGLARLGAGTEEKAADAAMSGSDTLTQTGALVGTPRYMAPEQLDGRSADARADQFAFAAVLYEALWGAHPFYDVPVEGEANMRAALQRGPAPPPARAGVSPRLRDAVLRGLAGDPAARWPSMTALLEAVDAARRPRGRRVALGVGGGLLVALGLGVASMRGFAPARSPCVGAAAGLDEVWHGGRRAALAEAFARVPQPGAAAAWTRTEAVLDDWAGRWRTLRVEVCEAAHGRRRREGAVLEARGACLARRLGELEALLGALAQPDAVLASNAPVAARALGRPEDCLAPGVTGGALGLPLEVRARAEVGAVRGRIARAVALRRLGKPREGLAEAEAAAVAADRMAYPQLVAEAYVELGDAREQVTQGGDGVPVAYYRALWNAEVAADDELRYRAWMGLYVTMLDASNYAEAARRLEHARAIAARLPPDERRAADLVYQASRLARYRSEDKLCVKLGAEAVAAYERAYGAESLETSMAYMNLGSCLGRAGDPEQGIGHFERALAIRRKLVGEDHPLVADALLTLGVAQKNLGRKQEALASYQQALAIRERVYGPDNTDVAAVRNNIANVLKDLGRYDEAMAHVTRAVAIWEGKWGPDSPAVAVGHSVMGHIEMDRGRFAEAEPHYRRALAIRQKRRPPGHPDITSSMMNVGWSLVKQGKKEGVPLLEEALARTKADEDSGPADLAEVTFLIGQALVTLRLDVKKGRALLEESCGVFAATKGWEDEAAECRTVLRSLEGD